MIVEEFEGVGLKIIQGNSINDFIGSMFTISGRSEAVLFELVRTRHASSESNGNVKKPVHRGWMPRLGCYRNEDSLFLYKHFFCVAALAYDIEAGSEVFSFNLYALGGVVFNRTVGWIDADFIDALSWFGELNIK